MRFLVYTHHGSTLPSTRRRVVEASSKEAAKAYYDRISDPCGGFWLDHIESCPQDWIADFEIGEE